MVKRRDVVNDLKKLGMIIDEGKRNNRHFNPYTNLKGASCKTP